MVQIPRTVYIHVGLPKTGTSYLQTSLLRSQGDLATHGVLYPGENHRFQRHGVWDLLGRRLRGVDQPRVPGSWQRLVDAVNDWEGDSVVLSDEFLVNARPAHVRRIVRAFQPAEVHVVVTVRDLERVIASMWYQEVSKGKTFSLSEYTSAVRDPETGTVSAGVAFWLRQDVRRVTGIWNTQVPADRIHVVVVPRQGSPAGELLERFTTATAIRGVTLTPVEKQNNRAVGMAEVEALRRLNVGLEDRLNERQYLRMMGRVLKPALRASANPRRITVPPEHQSWVDERSREIAKFLKDSPYPVVGDLDDLMPDRESGVTDYGQAVDEEEVAAASMAALTAAIEDYADFWWQVRRRTQAVEADQATRARSGIRAIGFRARTRALALADRSRLVAKAANIYLRRTSGPRR